MKTFSMVMAVLFIVGLLFVACDGGGTKDNNEDEEEMEKFEGTWMNPYGNHPAFTFTGSTYKHFNAFGFINEGTFTFTDTAITFVTTEGESWTQTYTLSGNTLSLDADGRHNYGPFVKNYEPEKTKFEGVWINNFDNTTILTFRYNCFSIFWDTQNYSDAGLFTFDDTSITFTDWNDNLKWKNDTYTLTDTTLMLSEPEVYNTNYTLWYFYGTWTKQPD